MKEWKEEGKKQIKEKMTIEIRMKKKDEDGSDNKSERGKKTGE